MVFYSASLTYGGSSGEIYTDPYVVPDGHFALILSINVYVERYMLAGRIGNVLFELSVALRENPTRYQPVWRGVLMVGAGERDSISHIGHLGFLRDGDKMRWYVHGRRDDGAVTCEGIVWLAQFGFEG